MAALYSILKMYKKHRHEHPASALSERTIRAAVRSSDLPSIKAGNRSLICDEVFKQWMRGELNDNKKNT